MFSQSDLEKKKDIYLSKVIAHIEDPGESNQGNGNQWMAYKTFIKAFFFPWMFWIFLNYEEEIFFIPTFTSKDYLSK